MNNWAARGGTGRVFTIFMLIFLRLCDFVRWNGMKRMKQIETEWNGVKKESNGIKLNQMESSGIKQNQMESN